MPFEFSILLATPRRIRDLTRAEVCFPAGLQQRLFKTGGNVYVATLTLLTGARN